MRYEMLRVFYIDCSDFKTENYPFLTEEIPKYGIAGGLHLQSLLFFLRFLYSRCQGN